MQQQQKAQLTRLHTSNTPLLNKIAAITITATAVATHARITTVTEQYSNIPGLLGAHFEVVDEALALDELLGLDAAVHGGALGRQRVQRAGQQLHVGQPGRQLLWIAVAAQQSIHAAVEGRLLRIYTAKMEIG